MDVKRKRREFLKMLLFGGLFFLFRGRARAFQTPHTPLKKAMFWKNTD